MPDMPDAITTSARQARPEADLSYQRALGDGLRLRWSTAADTERLADVVATVFRLNESDPLNPRSHAWVLDMMSGRDPLIAPDGFALVEDTTTGQIVSTACLLEEAWEYAGVRLPMGRPEAVVTREPYRRRGLVRAVFELIHARSEAHGDLVQGITGIEWYYRQFGYEYAVEIPRGWEVDLADIPPLPSSQAEAFTLRRAAARDIPFVAQLYDEERAPALVSTPIDPTYWRWAISEANLAGDSFLRVFVIEDAQSHEPVGYAMTGMSGWQGRLSVDALCLRDDRLWLRALPSVLRGLRAIGEASERAPNPQAPLRGLRFYMPLFDPAMQAVRAVAPSLRDVNNPYAWYVRVPDLPALLRHIAPVLERRLAHSTFTGYTGDLTLDFYRGGMRLRWDDGRLAAVEEWQRPAWGEAGARFPPGVFLQILFGYRSLAILRDFFPDVRAQSLAAELLQVLFPAQPSWAPPLG